MDDIKEKIPVSITPVIPVTPVDDSQSSTAELSENKQMSEILLLVKETNDKLTTLQAENAELKKLNLKLAIGAQGQPKKQAEDIISSMFTKRGKN